jgi:lipopolysaccharide/colanic/teichoic acid biosynthesis glycosyltransferase
MQVSEPSGAALRSRPHRHPTVDPQRLFDLALAIVLLGFALPCIGVIALVMLCREGRPIFYPSERMRSPSRSFTLWKFRTMTPAGADRGVSGGDKRSRVTRFGHWLRATRLDELPQIWNVLRGDIGFVGPRPPLREYVERFPELYAQVLASRPGITGLATLRFSKWESRLLAATASGDETDAVYCRRCIPRKARLDLIYQRNRSLCFDIRLIAITGRGLLAHFF